MYIITNNVFFYSFIKKNVYQDVRGFFDLLARWYTKEKFIKFSLILNDDSLYFEFISATKRKQPLYRTSDFSPNPTLS